MSLTTLFKSCDFASNMVTRTEPFCFYILGIRQFRDVCFVNLYYIYRNCCKYYANIVDPDQTPRVAASDRGLHCLSVAPLRYTGH